MYWQVRRAHCAGSCPQVLSLSSRGVAQGPQRGCPEAQTGERLGSFLPQQAHRMPPGVPQNPQPFGLALSFNIQRERPSPTLKTEENSIISVTSLPPPPTPINFLFFKSSLGASFSDLLLLLLTLPAVPLPLPCLPFPTLSAPHWAPALAFILTKYHSQELAEQSRLEQKGWANGQGHGHAAWTDGI